eukprot:TRINITY_DN2954_c0_g1_i1.p1 TRINITY_DN2954_c0_g1~~TRINITY_DN2954_c0_g1_i1.p1  ORF type:complete len:637 (-),score=170.96 TRINITY_DN2954_c0_g1_i1:36-1748(-)
MRKLNEIVKLNVGGTIFEVSKEAMTKNKKSLFFQLFEGDVPLIETEDGSFFLDRDPTHFDQIIAFINDRDNFTIPETIEQQEEMLQEAEYYQLEDLISLLKGKILKQARNDDLGEVNIRIRDEEDEARDHYYKNDEIASTTPYLHLINVFQEAKSFVYDNTKPKMPLIMDAVRKSDEGSSIVDHIKDFQRNFNAITPALEGLNWNNLFVAGGSVLKSLTTKEAPEDSKKQKRRNRTADTFYNSDIDMFIYGLDADGALAKIMDVFLTIQKNSKNPNEITCMRTSRTITICPGYETRHVQIVLRLYKTPAEVLLGFDLDCVGVGYDGKNVWALPRARRAINCRYNIVDPTRQTFRTTSYEYRLWKYSKRGYGVAIPGFKRKHVNSSIYLKGYEELQGLARLLFLEERDFQRQQVGLGPRYDWFDRNGYKLRPEESLQGKTDFPQNYEQKTSVAESLIDYNNGVLLRHDPRLPSSSVHRNLEYRVEKLFKTPEAEEGIPPRLFFIYGYGIDSILSASNFKPPIEDLGDDDEGPKFELDVPENIEFIGSLTEYVQSLPAVEEDWFEQATKDYE